MSGTAEIHDATLTPTKLELLAGWLPSQDWFHGSADDLTRVASYRFVDPDGEVGIETILVKSGGETYQVPLTYRSEPLAESEHDLIGTLEHSVLGTRYVYDAVGDPVYMVELLRVIHEGDTEADLSRGEKSMPGRGVRHRPGVERGRRVHAGGPQAGRQAHSRDAGAAGHAHRHVDRRERRAGGDPGGPALARRTGRTQA